MAENYIFIIVSVNSDNVVHRSKILFYSVLKLIYLSNGGLGLSGYGWPGHETGYSGLWVSHGTVTQPV